MARTKKDEQQRLLWCLEDKEQLANNLRANWFLPVSSAAFGLAEFSDSFMFWPSLWLAVVAVAIFAAFTKPLREWATTKSKSTLILALLASVGYCWWEQQYAYSAWCSAVPATQLSSGITLNGAVPISFVLAACSFPMIYLGTVYIWSIIQRLYKGAFLADRTSTVEMTIYAVLLVVMLQSAASAFETSNAYYIGKYDIVYTSDSPKLGVESAYFELKNWENDIRQPLFAVFSGPILGLPYLVGTVLNVSYTGMALLMNGAQIVMLLFSYFLLGRSMNLNSAERICWMLFCSSTYTCLLFSRMMDQYIVAFFWLTAAIYQACTGGRAQTTVVWAAAGTMLPSIVFLPLSTKHPFKKQPRAWCLDLLCSGLGFVALMIALDRFDIIAGLADRFSFLSQFTGHDVTWKEKVLQFLAFPSECFFALPATIVNDYSWRLSTITEVNELGITILLLAATSAALNWKKKSSRTAVVWIIVSVVALLFFGWGTAENGLNLYALYFGWAYVMLLYQFVEKIGEILHCPWLLPTVSIAVILVFLAINVPAIQALHDFVIERYPI